MEATFRYTIHVFMVYDTHEVELPNHETALRNLDRTKIRLRVERRRA
jgi:hypothetical protein